jgi:hypothetical protein
LSVDAVHDRLIWVVPAAVAARFDGGLGAWVSAALCVVAVAVLE